MVVVTYRFLALLFVLTPQLAFAGSARMTLEIAPGLEAEADYWPGEASRPPILILHGFLQTREFPTVRRLAEALADEGYSILLPSLTLGLDRRAGSVACEAIHTHTMQQDVAELRAWADWLAQRNGKPPVLIGHSTGGVQVMAMLDAHAGLPVDRAVLISLSYFGEELSADALAQLRRRAERDLATTPDAMSRYSLTYCTTYVTHASGLLSYLQWDRDVLGKALKTARVPVTVIYGERDNRIDQRWLQGLRTGGVTVRAVPGANHFFDLAHEFDLLDEVLDVIGRQGHG